MSDNTPLGDRMKLYERVSDHKLPPRTYTLMRLDGRAFHTYLRGVRKPFDMDFVSEMGLVTQWLCAEIQGSVFAYQQSDEISILLTDFTTTQTQPWVGGRVNKMVSLSAASASAYLYGLRQNHQGVPTFDCRVWPMTDPVEVANYFVWRQRDCTRNSIQAAGQHYFSPAALKGKSCDDIQEMLYTLKGVNWNDYASTVKRGQLVARVPDEGWYIGAAPFFKAEPGTFLADSIPPLPSLSAQKDPV